jgi:hypothetical protein
VGLAKVFGNRYFRRSDYGHILPILPILSVYTRSYPVILIIDCSQLMRWFGCICTVLCQKE